MASNNRHTNLIALSFSTFISLIIIHSALNPDIAGDFESAMGAENACSFQSLGYYLSTESNYFLQDATCTEPGAEDNSDTIVNFTVYCG
jgi:hypothetical protein